MSRSARIFALAGAVLAGTAVGLGAFAAHGLRGALSPGDLATFETGVRYQMYHGLGLLAIGWLPEEVRWKTGAGVAFIAGVILFSGSLYGLTVAGARWLGVVTPIGGVSFLAGWLALTIGIGRSARGF